MYNKEEEDSAALSIGRYIRAFASCEYLRQLAADDVKNIEDKEDIIMSYSASNGTLHFSIDIDFYKVNWAEQCREEQFLYLIAYLTLKKFNYNKLLTSPFGEPYIDCENNGQRTLVTIHLRKDLKDAPPPTNNEHLFWKKN